MCSVSQILYAKHEGYQAILMKNVSLNQRVLLWQKWVFHWFELNFNFVNQLIKSGQKKNSMQLRIIIQCIHLLN